MGPLTSVSCYWRAYVLTGWTERSRTGLSNRPDWPDGAAHAEERRIKHALWCFGFLHSKATDDERRAALHKRLQIPWNLLTRDKIYMRLSSGSAKKASFFCCFSAQIDYMINNLPHLHGVKLLSLQENGMRITLWAWWPPLSRWRKVLYCWSAPGKGSD